MKEVSVRAPLLIENATGVGRGRLYKDGFIKGSLRKWV